MATNAELLKRVVQCHADAGEVLQQLTEGTPPATVEDLYQVVKRLRNATRGAYCTAQELKNRIDKHRPKKSGESPEKKSETDKL